MKRVIAMAIVAAVAVSCDSPNPTTAGPEFAIRDGAVGSGGNPDFFWLPPLVQNPSGDANFDAGEFNGGLAPVVTICELSESDESLINVDTPCADPQPAGFPLVFTTTTGFGSEVVRLEDEHYMVNWHTTDFNLSSGAFYRVIVTVGTKSLGLADVDVVTSGKELKNVNTGEFIALKDGRTLPIKFRIENGALCVPPGSTPCASQTVNLPAGGTVTLRTNNVVTATVNLPPQDPSSQQTTITVQDCDEEIDLDLVGFPPCLTITADPPLENPLTNPGVLSLCTVDPGSFGLDDAQEPFVTLHRKDDEGNVSALPHVTPDCPEVVGQTDGSILRQFARAVGDRINSILGVQPLHATRRAVVLDVGGGGSFNAFSDFQFFLPAQMFLIDGADGQAAPPGSAVPVDPGVRVLDEIGNPVSGATVRVAVVDGDGTIDLSQGLTDQDGVFTVTWTLGEATTHSLRFFGNGIADPENDGPFMPDIPSFEGQAPVPVEIGEVFVTATVLQLMGSSSKGSVPNPGSIFSIEPSSGLATLVGATGILSHSASAELSGLEFDRTTGTLYGIAGSACSGAKLISVDPVTAAGALVGTLVGSGFDGSSGTRCDGGSDALAVDADGAMYAGGWNGRTTGAGGSLLKVDKATGAVLAVYPTTGGIHLAGLAFDGSGTLWASRGSNGGGLIHTINPTDGQTLSTLTLMTASGTADAAVVSDLAWGSDGKMYASLPQENQLAVIDLVTGLVTRIGSFGSDVSRMSGLTHR